MAIRVEGSNSGECDGSWNRIASSSAKCRGNKARRNFYQGQDEVLAKDNVKTKQHYCPLKQDHPNWHFRLIEMCNQIPPIIYLNQNM
jgi:hypothetical protein